MKDRLDAHILSEADNVATVLRAVKAGETLVISNRLIQVMEDIPLCHKLALGELVAGSAIVKYGAVIGNAKRLISTGEHVHVHNVESRRGKKK